MMGPSIYKLKGAGKIATYCNGAARALEEYCGDARIPIEVARGSFLGLGSEYREHFSLSYEGLSRLHVSFQEDKGRRVIVTGTDLELHAALIAYLWTIS